MMVPSARQDFSPNFLATPAAIAALTATKRSESFQCRRGVRRIRPSKGEPPPAGASGADSAARAAEAEKSLDEFGIALLRRTGPTGRGRGRRKDRTEASLARGGVTRPGRQWTCRR